MVKLCFVCAALLLFAGSVWAETETREERIVQRCTRHLDKQVQKLDEKTRVYACADLLQSEMDELYIFMLKHAEDREALRASRNKWSRDAAECKDLKAFAAAYIKRMDELWAAPAIANTPLDEREAWIISTEIVALSNTGALREYLLPPYNRKGLPEYLYRHGASLWIEDSDFFLRLGKDGRLAPYRIIFTGGTCHSSMFLPINPDRTENWAAREKDPALFCTDAGMHLDPVPGCSTNFPNSGRFEHPLLYRNRYFVVSTDYCPGAVFRLLEILPDGRMRTLAITETRAENVDLTPPANRLPVCGAILSEAVQPLQWDDAEWPENADTLRCPPCRSRKNAGYGWFVVELDLDGDGVAEHLGSFNYPESAACGGTVSTLFLLDAEHRRVLDTPLSRALQKVFSDWVESPDDPVRV